MTDQHEIFDGYDRADVIGHQASACFSPRIQPKPARRDERRQHNGFGVALSAHADTEICFARADCDCDRMQTKVGGLGALLLARLKAYRMSARNGKALTTVSRVSIQPTYRRAGMRTIYDAAMAIACMVLITIIDALLDVGDYQQG